MGGPKALMRVDGRAWHEVQRASLARVGIPATWVVSPDVLDAMQPACDLDKGAERLVLGDPAAPMFASVMRGLESISAESLASVGEDGGVFILPIDVPAPGVDVWQALADAGRVAIPTFAGKRGHPVFLPCGWVRSLLARLSVGDERHARLDQLLAGDAVEVPVNDPDVAVNLNTPEDVREWLASRSGPRSVDGGRDA